VRRADRQQPHEDELCVALDRRGTLEVEGERLELGPRSAAFVPAGAEHRFVGYEGRSVLLVFARPADEPADEPAGAAPPRIVPARTSSGARHEVTSAGVTGS
jgi:quercetin dioxygenase-like cupin family protein